MSWAAVATGVGTAVGGYFAGQGTGGSGSTQGYDVVQLPQYSFTEPRLRLTSDYVTQNLERMQRGENPAWWDRARPVLQQGLERGASEAYLGRPGQRTGALQIAQETGALTGLGPRGTFAQTSKVGQDYANRLNQINEYLTGLGVDIQREGEGRYLGTSLGIPQGPPSQVVQYAPTQSQGKKNIWGDLIGAFAGQAGNIPWGSLFGGGGGGAGIVGGVGGQTMNTGQFGQTWSPYAPGYAASGGGGQYPVAPAGYSGY